MRTGIAVIGANYGDEGKGAVTDLIASQLVEQHECTVVRFNGGAQAGHTVTAPDGRRHVFSHFGAGSFSGCPTYLSQFFIVNPHLFAKELKELSALSLKPKVSIDGRAMLTTPLDVFINQAIEDKRAMARHGSCGAGINETVTRCLRSPQYSTQAQDLLNPSLLRNRLLQLAKTWLPVRLKELRLNVGNEHMQEIEKAIELIASVYIDECNTLLSNSDITLTFPQSGFIIFEGAQGLMLDENRLDQYPHLTRSKTGLENVAFLCKRNQIDLTDVHYVTRTYLTKHGAGPLPNECKWRFLDATNVPNTYQGNLRFAPLNVEDLHYSIDLDFRRGRYFFPQIKGNLAVTCLDQHPMPDLSRTVNRIGLPLSVLGRGSNRQDMEFQLCIKDYLNSALKPISRAKAVLRA